MENAQNTFLGGMLLDTHPLSTPDTVLTNALNATLQTFNGNENSLLNDLGNTTISELLNNSEIIASLKPDYIILATVEFGNILYILSMKETENSDTLYEIGSFPSPNYLGYINDLTKICTNANYKDEDIVLNHPNEQFPLLNIYLPLYNGENETIFNTTFLDYDLTNTVTMIAEESYDRSVNLIISDGKHKPRLINSSFSVDNNNNATYIKRYNSNNTNRYSLNDPVSFDLQTSLYTDTSVISNFLFNGLELSGKLQVGNYVFYAITCDKDGNESDIICESGVIPVFLGTDGDPFSINGGILNQSTDKAIKLQISPLDKFCNYIKIYYTRSSSENNSDLITLATKLTNPFPVIHDSNKHYCDILITGYEESESVPLSSLNINYFNADAAKALALTQNILFLGNITENYSNSSNEYQLLKQLSLRFHPKADYSKSINLDSNYEYIGNDSEQISLDSSNKLISLTDLSYYNSKYIYYRTGYHENELYRFGIVYIRNDNSLTSVFDVLGINLLNSYDSDSLDFSNFIYPESLERSLPYCDGITNTCSREYLHNKYNIYGVCRIGKIKSLLDVIGIKFEFDKDHISDELNTFYKNNYKGFFFVRQKRIPTFLALAYTTNVSEISFLPSINMIDCKEDGSSKEKRYLFESFVRGEYKMSSKVDEESDYELTNFYPKNKGNNPLILSNNYKSRLFSLTDHTYCYFDKLTITDPILEYWKHINQQIDSTLFFDGFVAEQYGGIDDNDYLMLSSNNGVGYSIDNGTNSYRCDLYFFIKISEELTKNEPALQNFPRIVKEQGLIGINGTRIQVYRDDTPMYVIDYFCDNISFNTEIVNRFADPSISFDGGDESYYNEYFAGKQSQAWMGLENSEDYNEEFYFKCFDSNFNQFQNTEKNKLRVPKWIEYNGIKYKYYSMGPYYSEEYLSRMIRQMTNFFITYTPTKIQETFNGEINLTSETGYDLDIPTYNGKYGYPDFNKKFKAQDGIDECAEPVKITEYNSYAAFCPEYSLNKPYYNNIFTGQKVITSFATDVNYLKSDLNRLYKYTETNTLSSREYFTTHSLAIDEGVSLNAINHQLLNAKKYYIKHPKQAFFSSKAGNATDFTFKFVGAEFLSYNFANQLEEDKFNTLSVSDYNKILSNHHYSTINKLLHFDKPFNMVRGIYSPYVGMYPVQNNSGVDNFANRIINIYIPNYSEDDMENYFKIRFDDATAYLAISERISITNLLNIENYTCYRGDCYINWFTNRLNRNFNDDSAPYNDEILNSRSFNDGFIDNFDIDYRIFDLSKNSDSAIKMNLGDLNAVKLGSWITFPIRSTMNLSLRSTDGSWTTESFACKNDRSFYPLHSIDASGSYKISESDCYNSGFNKSGSERYYFNQENLIFENVYYKNRIAYSNILVNGSFQNGHRVFLSTHYKDYTDLYGSITKLVDWYGSLICICEHGIMLIPVNERALAGEGAGGNVYINTSNVLPENPKIISDTYGSLWVDSIIKTPYAVYGIDAVAKKIWKCNGDALTIISDFSIQSFLNKSLNMYNTTRKLGSVNIKTHYNAFKGDILFTAYDYNTLSLWNICYNEHLGSGGKNGWITFYSWIPSFSGNIGNQFISFDLQVDFNIMNDTTLDKIENDNLYNHINPIIRAGNKHNVWIHGQSDFLKINKDKLLPCYWYDQQHPFEFEFVINKNPLNHKIFNDFKILSNKAAPESFHYEIVGECYDLREDRINIYYRQELQKAFFKACGANVEYNKDFLTLQPVYSPISYYLPLYYRKDDITNIIEHNYQLYTNDGYDYQNMSGPEIYYDSLLKEFKLRNHVPAIDITKEGRIRGNMHYKEDIWHVQINSIPYFEKNEWDLNSNITWGSTLDKNLKLFLPVNNIPLPNEVLLATTESFNKLNETTNLNYTLQDLDILTLMSGRKEIKPKDKFLKIKVRYPGNELAVITGIFSTFTMSYA